MDQNEYSFMVIKPPSLIREGVVDTIREMIEQSGLLITTYYVAELSRDEAAQLYLKHQERDFYPWLIDQITSGPVGVLLIKGENAPRRTRDLAFKIREILMPPGETLELSREEKRAIDNVVHTPDPDEPGAVEREGVIFFPTVFES